MRFQILLSLAMAAVVMASPEQSTDQVEVAAGNIQSNPQVYLGRGARPARIHLRGAAKRSTAPDGLLQNVAKFLSGVESAVGITAFEDALDETFHGQITDIEDALGSTKLEQSLDALSGSSKDGVVQKVGALLKVLEDKLGVTYTEDALNKALGGKLVELEDKLGLTKLEQEGLGERSTPDGAIQKLGNLIAYLEDKLGVTTVEDALDKALDGKVTDLEESLGSNRAEVGLGLLKGKSKKGLLQAVGRFVKGLEDAVGVTALENALDVTFDGKIGDLEDKLGLTKLEKYLDLA